MELTHFIFTNHCIINSWNFQISELLHGMSDALIFCRPGEILEHKLKKWKNLHNKQHNYTKTRIIILDKPNCGE